MVRWGLWLGMGPSLLTSAIRADVEKMGAKMSFVNKALSEYVNLYTD